MDDSIQQNSNSQPLAQLTADDQSTVQPGTVGTQVNVMQDHSSSSPTMATISQDDRIQQLNNSEVQTKSSQSYHPVSSLHKEQTPIRSNEAMHVSEASESQPEISAELKEIGVEESKDDEQLKLSASQELAGLEPAKESVPMNSHIAASMKFPQQPFTGNEAADIIKTTSPDESKHWLAVLVLSILHKLHIKELRKKEESKLALVEKAA